MSGVRILGRPGQRRVLAPCRSVTHPAYVQTQTTQKKLRMQALGAEIARLRRDADMPRQADLKAVSGVSVRLISDIENGKLVASQKKMRALENALGLAPGTTDDYLDGKIDRLEPERVIQTRYPDDIDEPWKRDLWDKLRNKDERFRREVIDALADDPDREDDQEYGRTG